LFVLFAGLRWSVEISSKSQGDTSPYRKLYQQDQMCVVALWLSQGKDDV